MASLFYTSFVYGKVLVVWLAGAVKFSPNLIRSLHFGAPGKRVKNLGFVKTLLSRRDWVYLLSLLIPFTAYNLALKAYDVLASQSGNPRLGSTFDLIRSDVFFNLGYSLLWIRLFVTARSGLLRWTVVVLFHLSAVLVVIVITSAHWYFRNTGVTLDYDPIALWLSKVLAYELLRRSWVILLAVVVYMVLGPLLLSRVVSRWRGWPGRSPASLVLFLLALGCGSLSLCCSALVRRALALPWQRIGSSTWS
jgi:hypothetical protein